MNRLFESDYTHYVLDRFLIIEDGDLGNTSVTNNIQNVINEIIEAIGWESFKTLRPLVIYRDSMGTYDGVIINLSAEKKVCNFCFISLGNAKDAGEAIRNANTKLS